MVSMDFTATLSLMQDGNNKDPVLVLLGLSSTAPRMTHSQQLLVRWATHTKAIF